MSILTRFVQLHGNKWMLRCQGFSRYNPVAKPTELVIVMPIPGVLLLVGLYSKDHARPMGLPGTGTAASALAEVALLLRPPPPG